MSRKIICQCILLAGLTAAAGCERPEQPGTGKEEPLVVESRLKFRHHAVDCTVPVIWPAGDGVYAGMVSWGDIADDERYRVDLNHSYTSPAQFGVLVTGVKASKVRFGNLADIDLIDLSEF